jgi:hypothetical protein
MFLKLYRLNICCLIFHAPTGKSIGSEYVIKIGTDGFSRRSNLKNR